ncbi:hypothetical protein FALBO_8678 [Fusarium albosuccineum]|uniref:Uncharacterized protein n=1 Tax=Fusarium albosuccineum TaxID=1237068 RepID=A0A8H4LB46_9HYPO|nr:hypothetical protein FALBO_8678 [Fusarium albosuccineum]
MSQPLSNTSSAATFAMATATATTAAATTRAATTMSGTNSPSSQRSPANSTSPGLAAHQAALAPPHPKVPCGICPKRFSPSSVGDHRKVHRLEGNEGVDAPHKCEQCEASGKVCRVSANMNEISTFGCTSCLKRHSRCSHVNDMRPYPQPTLHPGLMSENETPWAKENKLQEYKDAREKRILALKEKGRKGR